jgi:YD repeat-containing protein
VFEVDDTQAGLTRSIDWTSDGRPFVLQDFDGTTTTYTYDGLGRRVIEQSQTETVRHVGALVDVSSTTGMTKYYFAGSRLIGAAQGTSKWWFHADRAGSVRAVTDATGSLVARSDFAPYASPVGGLLPIGSVFRSLRRGPTNPALFVGARLYDPEIARFLGHDTIVPDLLNP